MDAAGRPCGIAAEHHDRFGILQVHAVVAAFAPQMAIAVVKDRDGIGAERVGSPHAREAADPVEKARYLAVAEDGGIAVPLDDVLQFGGHVVERFVPRDALPFVFSAHVALGSSRTPSEAPNDLRFMGYFSRSAPKAPACAAHLPRRHPRCCGQLHRCPRGCRRIFCRMTTPSLTSALLTHMRVLQPCQHATGTHFSSVTPCSVPASCTVLAQAERPPAAARVAAATALALTKPRRLRLPPATRSRYPAIELLLTVFAQATGNCPSPLAKETLRSARRNSHCPNVSIRWEKIAEILPRPRPSAERPVQGIPAGKLRQRREGGMGAGSAPLPAASPVCTATGIFAPAPAQPAAACQPNRSANL